MWKSLLIVQCLCAFITPDKINASNTHPDLGLPVPALVAKHGYPIEIHTVITEDGYILTMHRIPYGINTNNSDSSETTNKSVVFLMHGIISCSSDWVVMGPSKGLAYLLADMGYDVWMGNARGNTYSRSHIELSPDFDQPKFWDFSWHEIGVYDLPTMIDYILNKTEEEQLFYIGHSQGTTVFFVMTSILPEYNDKIKLMIALAPIVYMKHVPNFALRLIAEFSKVTKWITNMLGIYEFLPSNKFIHILAQTLCNDSSFVQEMCGNILFLFVGYDSEQLNKSMIPIIASNSPAGAASKQFIHYSQEIKSGEFQQFDYDDKNKNFLKYQEIFPPKYDLSNVNASVALIYGNNDLLTSEVDIERLRQEIQNPVLKYKVEYEKFNHIDFLFSINVVPLLYTKIFELLEQFE